MAKIDQVPSEPIIVTLNKFGADGWELVQGGINADSSGFLYMLKRPLPLKRSRRFRRK
jgi:hypothetical protein